MVRALAVWSALGVACGAAEIVDAPAAPAGTVSALVASRATLGGALEVSAAEGEGFAAHRDGAVEVFVLYYARPLAELGLIPGDVPFGSPSAPCALAAPLEVWARTNGPFARIPLPAELRERLAPGVRARCGGCEAFDEARTTVPGDLMGFASGAPMADGRTLALVGEQQFAVAREGFERVEGCDPLNDYTAVRALGGTRFLLADWAGRVYTAEIAPPRCTLLDVRTTTTAAILWLTGSPDGRELFTLDALGNVHRALDGGPFELIGATPVHERFPTGSDRGGIAYLGPGEVVATASGQELTWISGGRVVRRQALRLNTAFSTTSAVRAAGGVVYVGDADGLLHVVRAPGEDEAIVTPFIDTIGSVLEDRDGLVIVAGAGVARWYPTVGFCPELREVQGSTGRGRAAYLATDGSLVLPDVLGSETQATEVVWLRPRGE